MQDLERAKLRLKERNLSLVVVKNGNLIFETESHGIRGFLEAIELLDKDLIGSSVADRIVGRATAFLCAYSNVSAVFAVTMSMEGARVLEDKNMYYQFEKRVPNILNQERSDICPFEKIAITFRSPEEAYRKLQSAR